jgi:virulence-associated protein VapD
MIREESMRGDMGMTRKQITFDLSQDALRQHYPRKETGRDPQFFKRAYKDIQRFMDANGFERRQYSVYVSADKLTALDVAVLTQRMAEQFPWLRHCVREITATNIGARHSLLGLLRSDVSPAELLPPVPRECLKKRKTQER